MSAAIGLCVVLMSSAAWATDASQGVHEAIHLAGQSAHSDIMGWRVDTSRDDVVAERGGWVVVGQGASVEAGHIVLAANVRASAEAYSIVGRRAQLYADTFDVWDAQVLWPGGRRVHAKRIIYDMKTNRATLERVSAGQTHQGDL